MTMMRSGLGVAALLGMGALGVAVGALWPHGSAHAQVAVLPQPASPQPVLVIETRMDPVTLVTRAPITRTILEHRPMVLGDPSKSRWWVHALVPNGVGCSVMFPNDQGATAIAFHQDLASGRARELYCVPNNMNDMHTSMLTDKNTFVASFETGRQFAISYW